MNSIQKKLDVQIKNLRKKLISKSGNKDLGCNKELLEQTMSNISEERWSAGWLVDLEYVLWREIFEDDKEASTSDIIDIMNLAFLAKQFNGWWTYDGDGRVFISLKKWVAKFKQHEKNTSRSHGSL